MSKKNIPLFIFFKLFLSNLRENMKICHIDLIIILTIFSSIYPSTHPSIHSSIHPSIHLTIHHRSGSATEGQDGANKMAFKTTTTTRSLKVTIRRYKITVMTLFLPVMTSTLHLKLCRVSQVC